MINTTFAQINDAAKGTFSAPHATTRPDAIQALWNWARTRHAEFTCNDADTIHVFRIGKTRVITFYFECSNAESKANGTDPSAIWAEDRNGTHAEVLAYEDSVRQQVKALPLTADQQAELAETERIYAKVSQVDAPSTTHGECPDEIMCRCANIFAPEIIDSHECPECGHDNSPKPARKFSRRFAMRDKDTGLWFVNEYFYLGDETSVRRETIADELTRQDALELESQRPQWAELPKPSFCRADIIQAHYVLECDYNVNGCLKERPSNQRRHESSYSQICRIKQANTARRVDLFEKLTHNGQAIYRTLEKRYGFTS